MRRTITALQDEGAETAPSDAQPMEPKLPLGQGVVDVDVAVLQVGDRRSRRHTMGFGGIEVMSRWNPSPLLPERPVSLTDQRTKEPAGAVFDDDSVICPMIPARFTPVMSGTT